MTIQNVTLIGLGAMGSFFAPRLDAVLGKEHFRVLAEGERKERLRDKGIFLNGKQYFFSLVEPSMEGEPVDLIIMAVKDTGLKQAIQDIRHQVGPHTQILCVMNGVDSEEQLAAVYGWEHVLYSYMRVSIVMQNGVAEFNPEVGSVHFGERINDTYSERVEAIRELFDRCGIRYRIDQDMVKGLWFKFMCNVGENMTCALLDVPFGAYHISEDANFIRRAAMQEVILIANKLGIPLSQADIAHQETVITNLPFANLPSTLQDLRAGRKTEVEMFAGKVVRLGKQLQIPTPYCELLYHGILVREEKIAGAFDSNGK